jgi:hypothetical protein
MLDLCHRKLMPLVRRPRSHQLSEIESQPDGRDGAATSPPKPPFLADASWAGYWSTRARAAARTDQRLRELDAENQTLRRIVADQSIELRRLRERRDQDQSNAPEESV